MRTFIAIPLPGELRELLANASDKTKRACNELKTVSASNIHLTLKFLGEIQEEQIPIISDAIKRACEGIGPFSLVAEETGVFPDLKRPRVFWVGLKGEIKTLHLLAQKIEDRLAGIGFSRESRPFSGHLTLGRFKLAPSSENLKKNLDRFSSAKFGEFSADRVILYLSELYPSGAKYTVLYEHKLAP